MRLGGWTRSARSTLRLAAFALAAALALVPASAVAKGLRPDPSFGAHGRTTHRVEFGEASWDRVPTHLAALPGGGTILLAEGVLYAYDADGSPRASFGGGRVAVPVPPGYRLTLTGLDTDSQGGVLVVGTARANAPKGQDAPEFGVLIRLTPSGQPDTTFGEGGTLLTTFGLPSRSSSEEAPARPTQVQVAGAALDSMGRIIVSGTRTALISPCRDSVDLPYRDAFLARLDADGSIDPTFGEGGVSRIGGLASVNAPLVGLDDDVYLSTPFSPRGPCSGYPGEPLVIGHFTSSGVLDSQFGVGGWRAIDPPSIEFLADAVGVSRDRKGRLLVFTRALKGGDLCQVKVKRLLPSGAIDRGFGRHGTATMTSWVNCIRVTAGAVDARDRPLVVGGAYGRGSGRSTFFIGRFTSSGFPDRSLSTNGWLKAGFGPYRAHASSLVLTGGRPVLAGTFLGPGGTTGIGLAAYAPGR